MTCESAGDVTKWDCYVTSEDVAEFISETMREAEKQT